MKFGSKGLLEQHGFARNRMWTIDDQPPSPKINGLKGHASVDLVLKPSEEDYKVWANRYFFLSVFALFFLIRLF